MTVLLITTRCEDAVPCSLIILPNIDNWHYCKYYNSMLGAPNRTRFAKARALAKERARKSRALITPEEDRAITEAALSDPDNPPVDEEWFKRARPAYEVLPEIYPKEVAEAMLRPRDRPKAERTKVQITLRLDPEVVSHFRKSGVGWPSRINAVLKRHVRRR